MTESNYRGRRRYRFNNQNNISPYDIHINSFTNGDLSSDDDFEIQSWARKKNYNKWLHNVRKMKGWENFKRCKSPEPNNFDPSVLILGEKPKDVDSVILVKSNKNTQKKNLVAGSKVRGQKYDDPEYIPRMVTHKMGSEISRARQRLNISQIDLAKRLNVNVNYIRDIELGNLVTFNSRDPVFIQMARELNLTPIQYVE